VATESSQATPIQIFISYSHSDAALVTPVVSLLRIRQGLVFQDRDGIEPGTHWREALDGALSKASLVVLFWCRHSNESAEVRKEYEAALVTGKNVLPVLLDPTPLPSTLTGYQWIDFQALASASHDVELLATSQPRATPTTPVPPTKRVKQPALIGATLGLLAFGAAAFLYLMTERSGDAPPEIVASSSSTGVQPKAEPPASVGITPSPATKAGGNQNPPTAGEPAKPAEPPKGIPKPAPNPDPGLIQEVLRNTPAWVYLLVVAGLLAAVILVSARRRSVRIETVTTARPLHQLMADEIEVAILKAFR